MSTTLFYYGHTCFSLKDRSHNLLFDPFLTGNPQVSMPTSDIHGDYVLLTHGHSDHLGDAIPIARRCDATIIAPLELAKYCEKRGAKGT